MPGGVISTTMKLNILGDFGKHKSDKYVRFVTYQFVAVPRAAPFVRMAMELISVGYS
jgi:hypothetical protein